jgi:molecular chaperone DnaK
MTSRPIAIGIDLGTTFSVVAHLDADGKPRSVSNAEGDLTTPSVVLFDRSAIVVGKEAVKAAALEPDRIADFAKRDMGSSFYSRPVAGERYPPEVIQSLILEKLKRDAERVIGPFTQAVVTVPAFFNEPRRKATQDAGRLAGLEVLDIINEPTAAALVYGVQQGFLTESGASSRTERVLVYDLGGGTFDVTLMEIAGRNYRTLATAGDVYLGGVDWDRRIVDHLAERFRERYRGLDPRSDPRSRHRMQREAEDAKRALSVRDEVMVTIEHGGEGMRQPLTRAEFEGLTADLLERTLFTTRKLVKDAGLAWSDLTRLLLVGGSTRMPAVARALERESGMRVDRSLSADEAVAHGAALYAGFLLDGCEGTGRPSMTVQNVNSHDLGVLAGDPRTGTSRNIVLIPRNTPLPAKRTRRFQTARANQRSVSVHVIEGGDASGKQATRIGKCIVAGLPPGLPAQSPVEVRFQYASNGRLTVVARLPSVNVEQEATIERASGLDGQALAYWAEQRSRRRHVD